MQTFKILGILLTYPKADWVDHVMDMKTVLEQENLLPPKKTKKLYAFMDKLARRNLMKSQEDYVALFDRGRAYCLHLFEHVHGESRDRGQAMVDLSDQYKEKGLVINAAEMPDYLPMFLEFLALCEPAEAQDMLGEAVHIIAAIGAKLDRRKSDYASVFAAIAALTDAKIDMDYVNAALSEDAQRDDSLEALDREWEDAPAFDGAAPGGTGAMACNSCDTATISRPTPQQSASAVRH